MFFELGRSKRLVLNHISRGITALILMSTVAPAADDGVLWKAAYNGDLLQVRTLLEKGADIDSQNIDGLTAVMAAAAQGHEEIVQTLLAKGAAIDLQAQIGVTALILA